MAITYSKAAALKLLHYYQPLLLGTVMSSDIVIDFLDVEPTRWDAYQVFAYGVDTRGKKVKWALHRVTKEHGHTPPQEIAKYLSLINNFE